MTERFQPLFEVTRGNIVESIHYGAIAIVASNQKLLYSYGDPQTVAFLRSSAKPFQALPFVERGGVEHFGFTPRELALSCSSHETAQIHLDAVKALQKKIGIKESDLQCGAHLPGDPEILKKVIINHITPTANFNNCSGKHTAMLAHAKMRGLPLETYLERDHPIQQDILTTFAEMCGIENNQVELGTDGCSAPNFAVPLLNAAFGFARLCDPVITFQFARGRLPQDHIGDDISFRNGQRIRRIRLRVDESWKRKNPHQARRGRIPSYRTFARRIERGFARHRYCLQSFRRRRFTHG